MTCIYNSSETLKHGISLKGCWFCWGLCECGLIMNHNLSWIIYFRWLVCTCLHTGSERLCGCFALACLGICSLKITNACIYLFNNYIVVYFCFLFFFVFIPSPKPPSALLLKLAASHRAQRSTSMRAPAPAQVHQSTSWDAKSARRVVSSCSPLLKYQNNMSFPTP